MSDIKFKQKVVATDLQLSNLTASQIVETDASKNLVSAAKNTAYNRNFEATSTNIAMNGTQAVGVLSTVARGDHVHPTDTSRLSTTLTNGYILVGNESNVATAVAMSSEATISNLGAVTLANGAVIGKVLTGFTSGAGSVSAADSILGAIQKLDGNIAGKAGISLSNLSSVAINTHLVAGADNTVDLGSGTYFFKDLYLKGKARFGSNSQVTTIAGSASASASVDYILPPAAPTASGQVLSSTTGGVMSWKAVSTASAGDISETSFAPANNQAVAADVTGLAFANGTVRSFSALVSVFIDATTDLYETFELKGVQKGASWDLAVVSVGDDSQIVFSITAAGQIQYTSADITGFSSATMKFRAITTSV